LLGRGEGGEEEQQRSEETERVAHPAEAVNPRPRFKTRTWGTRHATRSGGVDA